MHDSLALMERMAMAEGCPGEQAPLVASMIVAQARGLQLDLFTANDRVRVDRTFTLFITVIDSLRRTWPTATQWDPAVEIETRRTESAK